MMESNEDALKEILEKINLAKIIKYMDYPSHLLKAPAFRIIGNLCLSESFFVDKIIENGALIYYGKIISSNEENDFAFIKEALWAVSNIAEGPVKHIQKILESGCFQKCIKIGMNSIVELGIKCEAIHAVCNCVKNAEESQIFEMTKYDLIDFLCNNLSIIDMEALLVILDAIVIIFDYGEDSENENGNLFIAKFTQCGGHTKLESLLMNLNVEIYKKVTYILNTYFDDNTEQDMELQKPSENFDMLDN